MEGGGEDEDPEELVDDDNEQSRGATRDERVDGNEHGAGRNDQDDDRSDGDVLDHGIVITIKDGISKTRVILFSSP